MFAHLEVNGGNRHGETVILELPVNVAVRDRRLLRYDHLPDVRQSIDCRNVLDAKLQYPDWTFVEGRGRLKRHLIFDDSDTWLRMPEDTWASTIYAAD